MSKITREEAASVLCETISKVSRDSGMAIVAFSVPIALLDSFTKDGNTSNLFGAIVSSCSCCPEHTAQAMACAMIALRHELVAFQKKRGGDVGPPKAKH